MASAANSAATAPTSIVSPVKVSGKSGPSGSRNISPLPSVIRFTNLEFSGRNNRLQILIEALFNRIKRDHAFLHNGRGDAALEANAVAFPTSDDDLRIKGADLRHTPLRRKLLEIRLIGRNRDCHRIGRDMANLDRDRKTRNCPVSVIGSLSCPILRELQQAGSECLLPCPLQAVAASSSNRPAPALKVRLSPASG
jgi:hypothetical protein